MSPATIQWLEETGASEYLPRLRAALKAQGITQQALAQHCGCSPSHIGTILRGNYPCRGQARVPKYVWEAARSYLQAAQRAADAALDEIP